MLRIKYTVFQGAFLPAFKKLMNQPGLNQRVAYNVSKLATKLEKASQQVQDEFLKLVNQYALKDEKGKISEKNGPGSYTIPDENEAAWHKAMAEFEQKEVGIDRHPFMVNDFAQASLTPMDYLALDPIIKDLELAAEKPAPVTKIPPPQGA